MMPTLNPDGHQSTKRILRFVVTVSIAAFTSFEQYIAETRDALDHVVRRLNTELMISATLSCSWDAISELFTGAKPQNEKNTRGPVRHQVHVECVVETQ